MSNSTIIYSLKEHVAHITLNRPRVGNVINPALARELTDICERISQDDNIYVVVITGAGEKAFCRGHELEQIAQSGKTVKTALAKLKETGMGFSVASAIASIDRPVIAAINGDAFGQGVELALSCDVRLATQTARFGFPLVASGLMPSDGGTQRLPRIIGRGKALELVLTGEIIDAEEALAIGLVSQMVPPPDLMATAEALAQNIAGKAPIALRFIKEAVHKGLDLTLEQGLRLEADLYFLLHTTADRTEGIRAFLEKRQPRFKGQ
jgi:enoyl-CoA hydratase